MHKNPEHFLSLLKKSRVFLPFCHRIQGSLDWKWTSLGWRLWAYDEPCCLTRWRILKCRFQAASARRWKLSSSRPLFLHQDCFDRAKRLLGTQTLDFCPHSNSCSSQCALSNPPSWTARRDRRSQTGSYLWSEASLLSPICAQAGERYTCHIHNSQGLTYSWWQFLSSWNLCDTFSILSHQHR